MECKFRMHKVAPLGWRLGRLNAAGQLSSALRKGAAPVSEPAPQRRDQAGNRLLGCFEFQVGGTAWAAFKRLQLYDSASPHRQTMSGRVKATVQVISCGVDFLSQGEAVGARCAIIRAEAKAARVSLQSRPSLDP
jgi:hypothetical protein